MSIGVKLVLSAIVVAVIVYLGQTVYDKVRLDSGPNAWYLLARRVDKAAALHGESDPRLLDGPFSVKRECEARLEQITGGSIALWCQQMLVSDATRLKPG